MSMRNDVYTSSSLQTRCFCQNFGTKNMRIRSVCVWSQVVYEQLGLGNQRKGRNWIFGGTHSKHLGSHKPKTDYVLTEKDNIH